MDSEAMEASSHCNAEHGVGLVGSCSVL